MYKDCESRNDWTTRVKRLHDSYMVGGVTMSQLKDHLLLMSLFA